MAANNTKKLKVPKGPKAKQAASAHKRTPRKPMLTEKMKIFAQEFMLDKNSTQAAIRTGYNPRVAHSTGFKLFTNPLIKQEIIRLQELEIENYQVTHQMITNELYKIAFSDLNDFVEVVETGSGATKEQSVVFKPTSALGKGKGKIIKTLEIGRRGIKLQLHSKEQALEMLAKHVGYFGIDNSQKTPKGVLMYIPENGRGDVIDSGDVAEDKKIKP